MPEVIMIILTSPAFRHVAIVLLTSFFWLAGLFGLFKFDVMVQTIAARGLAKPR